MSAVPSPHADETRPTVSSLHPATGPLWYWRLGYAPGHEPCVRALLDGTGARRDQVRAALVQLTKKSRDCQLPDGGSFGEFVYGYLLDALRRDPMCAQAHLWTCYPAHSGPSDMLPLLSTYLPTAGPLSADAYLHLLVRHRPAIKAAYARRRGLPVTFADQVQTVHVDGAHRSALRGRRILVLDDYTTRGFSFEWARLLLLAAGAAGVVCVSLAKCGLTYERQTLRPGRTCDPFHPVTLGAGDFAADTATVTPYYKALRCFREGLRQMGVR